MSRDLLLEIGTEEMPANVMPAAVSQLAALAKEKLSASRLSYENVKVYGTPRRLAVLVTGAAERQADESLKKRGPSVSVAFDADGKPTRAAEGFARGLGISADALVRDGDYVWADVVNVGKPAEEILPEAFTELVTGLSFGRSMHWGSEEFRFIRPIRWLVALCGENVVPMEIAHVQSGRISRGHRVLSKGDVEIKEPAAYVETMRAAYVIVDQDERREMIRKGLLEKAAELSGVVRHNAELLEEINYIVEYPTALYGRIDAEFLQLPVPAVVTPMRDHQRYYPVQKEDGSLLPYFLTVRNGGTHAIENVQVGNERVLRARLDDAKFFFDNDRKKSLEGHREDSARINYQEGMGTMVDKADRIGKLSAFLADALHFTDEETKDALRAAYLSKADLATGMVTEFTELQGEMGKEYALLDGEKTAVAQAIFEQYMPRFAGDILPETQAGRAVSLADKLDNLAATFLRGLIPTGSQDPFALRRQTIGAVHILADGKLHLDIREAIAKALALLPGETAAKEKAAAQIEDFFRQRIRGILLETGIDYDIVDAVLADPIDDIYAIFLRAESLKVSGVKDDADFRAAVTRLANITKGKEETGVDPALFAEEAERNLWQAAEAAKRPVDAAYAAYDYAAAVPALQKLVAPINAYLDAVMVMADDPAVRKNRLATLCEVLSLFRKWADFGKLV